MSFITFEINELMIQLMTNLPSDQDTPRAFTRSMLSIPPTSASNRMPLGNYPLITADVKYPKKYLHGLDYQERINFFFNKTEFATVLRLRASKTDERRSKSSILERNVWVMLSLLFPTSNNVSMSKDLLTGDPTKTYTTRSTGFFSRLSGETGNMFSYLRIENKTYTVDKVVWLNDVLNHPRYNKLVMEHYNATRSASSYRRYVNLLSEFRTIRKSTNTDLQKMVNDTARTERGQIARFLDYVKGRYVDNTEEADPALDKLTDVGVSILAEKGSRVPTREIYVMIDLAEGEISEANPATTTCADVGERLGNEVKYLWDRRNETSDETWNAFRNRPILTSSLPDTSAAVVQPAADDGSASQPYSEENELQSNFEKMIASEGINNAYSALVRKYPDPTKRAPVKVIEFVKQASGDSANKLYEVIKEWNDNLLATNTNILNRMAEVDAMIDAEIADFNSQLQNNSSPLTTDVLPRMIDTRKLYKMILAELMQHEKKKSNLQGGTTRRARRRHKRKGKKTRKSRSSRKRKNT